MKKYILLIIVSVCIQFLYSQTTGISRYYPEKTVLITPKNHEQNLKKMPVKSFYESKSRWQNIIDSVWGPGAALSEKQKIFNSYCNNIRNQFDGFESLKINWDSLRTFWYSRINDSTSRGGFDAIMNRLYLSLRDFHTRAYDSIVNNTALNPGVPLLVISGFVSVEHFGAVLTVLEDSTLLVLRAVKNHPLGLEAGDIILGYDGIPWKILVNQLIDAGLPILGYGIGAGSAYKDALLIGAGMNWHLFDTIDIVKHSSGDTLHLSVSPMINFNSPIMLNNEQVAIPGVPFPDYLHNQFISYGIIDNTNIGYIYLYKEDPEGVANQQFTKALNALQNTNGLIIDMRFNMGGSDFLNGAFSSLFNESILTLEDGVRCNSLTYDLCPSGNENSFSTNGLPPKMYDRPIAVLLGPTCVSMGDITAQRLRYHPMVKFFGKSSAGSLGDSHSISSFPGWTLLYSAWDMFRVNQPGEYLNRKEFPVDFPVWHTQSAVVQGKDAVVEAALKWMNNLVYPHNISIQKIYFPPVQDDTLNVSADIKNPNNHIISGKVYIINLDGELIDSLKLKKNRYSSVPGWSAQWIIPPKEETYKVSVTAFDQTDSETFTLPDAVRFTTAGPVVLDSIEIMKGSGDYYFIRPFVINKSNRDTITNAKIRLTCNDQWAQNTNGTLSLSDLPPGASTGALGWFTPHYIDSLFPGYFDLNFEISGGGWSFWKDSIRYIVTGIKETNQQPLVFRLDQNYPNPFNPATEISYQIPVKSHVILKVYDILGKKVALLVNEVQNSGNYSVTFNGSNLASGIYFYKLQAGNYRLVKKMILLK